MTLSSQASLDDWEEAREERSAIMEHEGGASREQADTWSQEWLMECLARQILAWLQEHGRPWVEEWLGRYGDRHGADAERRLRDRVNEVRRDERTR